jgi:membrane protein DedA with SNARE-associated domain
MPNRQTIKHYLKLLSVPLLLLVLSFFFQIVWEVFSLPPAEEMAAAAGNWFDTYGLPAFFASAVLEGMLLVGGYFPGVFVVSLGIVLTNSPLEAAIIVAVGTAGLIIAHILNYTLGRYGWYRLLAKFGLRNAMESERDKLVKRGSLAIFLSYWLPSAAAITDTAAGIMRMPFKTFLLASVISTIFWDTIVGTLVYVFKSSALSIAGAPGSSDIIFYAIIAVWMIVLIIIDNYKRKKSLGINKGLNSIP